MPLQPAGRTGAAALAFIAVIAALVAGCGGGGGSGAPPAANQQPIATARLSGESVANADTNFDVTGTTDPDGTIAARSWTYGDGQTGTSNTHVYATPGNYTATYTVTDDRGAAAGSTVQVAVRKCSSAGTAVAATSPYLSLCMQTSQGEMVVELFPANAPQTVANFLKYVDDGFFIGTIFHRVEGAPNNVIQAGGYTGGAAGPTAKVPTYGPIPLESNNGLSNRKYTIGMARTAVLNSATSQFYVNTADNLGFDYNAATGFPGYAVFGQVLFTGYATVDAIAALPTATRSGLANVPVTDVTIRSIVRMP